MTAADLAQLEQLGGRFLDFAQGELSQIKGLEARSGGSGHVVPTLGIDQRYNSSLSSRGAIRARKFAVFSDFSAKRAIVPRLTPYLMAMFRALSGFEKALCFPTPALAHPAPTAALWRCARLPSR